jgi:purine-binding chemotaxis protein CheW
MRGQETVVEHQYCTFVLDGHLFGVPVAAVQEVLRAQEVTAVPLAPTSVAGLINLRGQIVMTVDLRTRLGLAPREEGARCVNVVVRALDGTPVSLVVDEIGDVLEPGEQAYEASPETLAPELRSLVNGVFKLPDRLLLVLDTEGAVSVAPGPDNGALEARPAPAGAV